MYLKSQTLQIAFFIHNTTRECCISLTILVCGSCQAISSKSKCKIRVFPLSYLNISYFCRYFPDIFFVLSLKAAAWVPCLLRSKQKFYDNKRALIPVTMHVFRVSWLLWTVKGYVAAVRYVNYLTPGSCNSDFRRTFAVQRWPFSAVLFWSNFVVQSHCMKQRWPTVDLLSVVSHIWHPHGTISSPNSLQ